MAGWMCVDGWMKFGGVCGIYLTVKGVSDYDTFRTSDCEADV